VFFADLSQTKESKKRTAKKEKEIRLSSQKGSEGKALKIGFTKGGGRDLKREEF